MSSFLSQKEIEQLMNKLNSDVVDAVKSERMTSEAIESSVGAGGKTVAKEIPIQEIEIVRFPELEIIKARPEKRDLTAFRSVPVRLSLDLGAAVLTIRDVLSLQKGSIVKLNKLAGENVTLRVNGRSMALGEVVVINDNFGFRVTGMGTTAEKEKEQE
ncbi:MAG: FliM/FliN family flagellar motor switch protein [Clostridiales bacterium]|jgi:flagellar motor switch protein FliN/FliY|nr:FliM/FliN family flagellar motor switch protein [Clostridiales bacterium]